MPRRLTNEEFIAKAHKVHNGYYSYGDVDYTTAKVKVSITCPVHGNFAQTPSDHLSGRNCRKCANVSISKSRSGPNRHNKVTKAEFIARATKKHTVRYDYSNVSFDKVSDKVTIGCPVHGDFTQSVNKHLLGNGCQECAKRSTKNTYSYSRWGKSAETSKHFDSFKMYVIRCCGDDGESFIKVGKTFKKLEKRFRSGTIPYRFEVLKVVVGDATHVSDLEREVQNNNKHHKYTPSVPFCGKQECFTKITIGGEVYER